MANVFDARYYRIPNQLIVLGYAASFCLNITANPTASGITTFIVRALAPVLILLILYILGGLGAGDIKLFSLIATVVGLQDTCKVMIVSVVLAVIAVLIIVTHERKLELKRRLHYSFYISGAFFLLSMV